MLASVAYFILFLKRTNLSLSSNANNLEGIILSALQILQVTPVFSHILNYVRFSCIEVTAHMLIDYQDLLT